MYCHKCEIEYAKTYRAKNSDKIKALNRSTGLIRNAGVTVSTFEKLLKQQRNVCAICKKSNNINRHLSVDHNHANKNIRGLLCNNCNRGLGAFFDNSKLLRAAIHYLEDDGKSIESLVERVIKPYTFPEEKGKL